jgi:C4-dicarboxylate-specific signal transduction histidine kinase
MNRDPDDTTPAARKPRAGAEAARYAVLRRLGPVLKHDMVVNLQAISMMAEVLNARIERSSPSPADFQANISKLNRLARDAVTSCLKVATWIEPGEEQGVRLSEGVDECLALLNGNFNFRGFTVSREVTDGDFQVWRIALRNLLVASLISLTDSASGPCEVRVKAEARDGFAEITVNVSPREDVVDDAMVFEPGYRCLEWSDVQALAAAESVDLVRDADQITMRLPRAVATAPLQIAPV